MHTAFLPFRALPFNPNEGIHPVSPSTSREQKTNIKECYQEGREDNVEA